MTVNKNLNTPANNSNIGTWDVPVNANWTSIDAALGGNIILNPNVVGYTITLTAAQYLPTFLIVGTTVSTSVTITGNVTYTIPAGVGGQWTVYNNTSGAFTVTIASAGGGTSVVVGQGLRTGIGSDGTNIFITSSTSTLNAAGANTQIQFNTGNALAGSANLTFNPASNAFALTGSMAVTGTLSVSGATSINGLTVSSATGSTLSIAPSGSLVTSGAFSITFVASGATSVTLPTSGTLISNSVANTYTANQTFSNPIFINSSASGPVGIGPPRNLLGTQTSSGLTTCTWTADALYLEDSSFNVLRVNNFSSTLSVSVTGLNGIDTGSVAASNWYYVYAISNGTTPGLLASLSPTSVTFPGGYSYKQLIGAFKTDVSSKVVAFIQLGADWSYITQVQFASGGNAGSAISLAGYIPASRVGTIKGSLNNGNSQNTTSISLNSTSGVLAAAAGSGGSGYATAYFEAPNVGASLYYSASTASGATPFAYVNGFRLLL